LSQAAEKKDPYTKGHLQALALGNASDELALMVHKAVVPSFLQALHSERGLGLLRSRHAVLAHFTYSTPPASTRSRCWQPENALLKLVVFRFLFLLLLLFIFIVIHTRIESRGKHTGIGRLQLVCACTGLGFLCFHPRVNVLHSSHVNNVLHCIKNPFTVCIQPPSVLIHRTMTE
jgi:hypothetical protein